MFRMRQGKVRAFEATVVDFTTTAGE